MWGGREERVMGAEGEQVWLGYIVTVGRRLGLIVLTEQTARAERNRQMG